MTQRIVIDLAQQHLLLWQGEQLLADYDISSAEAGAGEQQGSGCTPRGKHYIRAKIGEGLPEYAVLRGRRFTGEVWDEEQSRLSPERDWILSRILWLCGLEPGFNRGGSVDSMRRFIYIHGTPDTEPMGIPRSHGCIRMRNRDVIDLFDRVDAGCPVLITE